jgi:Tfp pilus assembly protein PilV
MVAAVVLVLGITTAIVTLQRGFQALDTARNLTYASQVMQSELERLRLKSWVQIEDLQRAGDAEISVSSVAGATRTLRCTRTIRDLKADMKEITLVSGWTGYDGRAHSVRYVTRYSKTGLYDYFYTAH